MPRVELHIGPSIATTWASVALPWFEEAAKICWRQQKSTLVVVPYRSHASALKGLLLERGLSHLGVHLVSPAELRELLARENDPQLPLREHLRLLLAIAAEEIMDLPDEPAARGKRMLEPDFLAAKSVARAPDHLLRAIDQLGNAGWKFSAVSLASLHKIEKQFQKYLTLCGFELIHTTDRRAVATAKKSEPLFANILVTGFNAAHWPLWHLLRAGVASAERATVLLEDPRDEARDADEMWVGTWEEAFGAAEPVAHTPHPTGEALFTESEMKGEAGPKCSFVVGIDSKQQAEAVALTCAQFLSEKNCTRIGVVFAGSGPLPRLVANALLHLTIPHNDGFGHPAPEFFESPEWRAWLHLQRGPRINSLVRFLSALKDRETILPGLVVHSFERALRRVHAEVLIDDLGVLQKFCDGSSESKKQQIAQTIGELEFLPVRADLHSFLQATEKALTKLGWKQRWTEISIRSRQWPERINTQFSRTLFLRWLEEIASSFRLERDAVGDHAYARVHLLPIAQAAGQQWSHVIFAGFNEGTWPPPEKGEFAREQDILEFNRSIRQLNRRSTKQGKQGEGHVSVREGHALYLGPPEHRQIALRQFEALLESATEGAAFGASLTQESAPDRFWNPNELFTRHYQRSQNSTLTQVAMKKLQRATEGWLQSSRSEKKQPISLPEEAQQTRVAFDARREPARKSDEYDFALRSAPERIPALSVSEFEALLKSPALVWMKKFLGVEGLEDDTNPWSAATGQWVHDWLAQIAESDEGKKFSRIPDLAGIDGKIRAAAKKKCAEIEHLCKSAGKQVPDWWRSGWQNAFYLARHLGGKLATIQEWPWMATEWTIDNTVAVKVSKNVSLQFSGRIDLILSRQETKSLENDELWILDYKTGASKKALTPAREDIEKRKSQLHKKLLDGTALQLALYGFALRHFGATEVFLSLLAPAIKPITPQLSVSNMDDEADIFDELARMQRTGVFGMRGLLRSDWAFTRDYPLATVAIDPDLLEERWEITHPALAKEEEDYYW